MATLLTIVAAWDVDTAKDPEKWAWSSEPSTGQCVPTALCVQDLLGGTIHVGMVGRERHYWNDFGEGGIIDLTRHQYGTDYYRLRPIGEAHRAQLLRNRDTRRRYETLRERAGITPD
jgi:hypothetical protein